MSGFFSGLFSAGTNTLQALYRGPATTLEEMYEGQKARFEAFNGLMSTIRYKPNQIQARKQYWCAQTLFLAQLIQKYPEEFQRLTQSANVSTANDADLSNIINALIHAIDDDYNLQWFLDLLKADGAVSLHYPIENDDDTPLAAVSKGIQFFNGDVINLIKELAQKGTKVVVDNAANSHRDGGSKYTKGSVEELLSRYTDSALKMALHFDDVHRRNYRDGQYAFTGRPPKLDVLNYQRRYIKMVLTICAKLVEQKEAYLESAEFLQDLFTSFPNEDESSTQLPIYFDMQNNAYEVPVNSGFSSGHWFRDTTNLNTVEGIFSALQEPTTAIPLDVVGYAAPDLRRLETSPLDARATSNKTLQNPDAEGNLGCMLSAGIQAQCEEAIRLAEENPNQPIAVVFIMPGCGAFKNPEKSTAAHFISSIKYFYPELQAKNINCYVAEFNPELHQLLEQTNEVFDGKLGELNSLINYCVDPLIRQKTIAVREQLVRLIESEGYTEELDKHLSLTIDLLSTNSPEDRSRISAEYKENAKILQDNNNTLWQALGIAMFALGVVIAIAGVAFSLTGATTAPGLVIAGCGTLLAAAGLGIFAPNDNKITELSMDLIGEELSSSTEDWISSPLRFTR
ncbi:hypothetical protein BN59_03274 [Legionella massiliensis]|uniref:Uncharacterized protein n=1 Tax=Legionella massiliensis TaxID=1034943 RepID=A0A078L4F6_9GAMM|nr:DUF2975 domain-containing protein [Legionella massiliensis]CDZ78959.1 hypothetical protein BN59_03274 [Legionella massiliensis]CEE14697.1 hypothetical protein BN1094_03274 [Legionella massiliensis]